MTVTFPAVDRPAASTRTGPNIVLDLPVAMAAVRGLTGRIVLDRRGGPVVDSSHPLGVALVPHAARLGAWVSTDEPTSISELRRLAHPAVTVVLTGADRHIDRRPSGADIEIVDEISPTPNTTQQLLNLTAGRRRLPRSPDAGLLGFAIDLPRGGAEADGAIDALRAGWTWWRREHGTDRPVVLLRSGSVRGASRASHALHRWATSTGNPAPIIRLDITGVCTTIAASTVVTVLECAEHPGVVEVVVNHLPPTFHDIRVAGSAPGPRTSVLIRDAHRMVATEIEGPLTPGARLIASGWSGLAGPLSVLETSATPFTAASHQSSPTVA